MTPAADIIPTSDLCIYRTGPADSKRFRLFVYMTRYGNGQRTFHWQIDQFDHNRMVAAGAAPLGLNTHEATSWGLCRLYDLEAFGKVRA